MKSDLNTNRLVLSTAIDQFAKTCSIDRDLVEIKVKEALQMGYNKEINFENELLIETVPESGDLLLFEEMEVVDQVENSDLEIDLVSAQKIQATIKQGEKIKRPVLMSSFSYFAILKVSQVIKHFVNVSESEKTYQQFIGKKGTILSGTVENIDYRYFSVDIGNIFAFIPKEEQIPFEHLRHGERIKFYVQDVFQNHHFGQVMGSRRCNEFLAKLFALEVPEVGSGIIVVKKIVREPGLRAKVALVCKDNTIDPIGSCIGRGGSRIKAISQELRGEKIDIFLWDDKLEQLIINASSPSKVVNIHFLTDNKVRIIVLETQYPVAIGKLGAAVRLLGQMTGYEIDIQTLESFIVSVSELELNGNLSYIDLEKLEIDPAILIKCFEPDKKETTSN